MNDEFQSVGNDIQNVTKSISEEFGEMTEKLTEMGTDILNEMEDIGDDIKLFIETAFDAISMQIKKMVSGVTEFIEDFDISEIWRKYKYFIALILGIIVAILLIPIITPVFVFLGKMFILS